MKNAADLARTALEEYFSLGRQAPLPADVSPELLEKRAGAFVTLHSGDELRGCIGTLEPTRSSLAEEIVGNALSAALRDPRFPSVSELELADLEISVDILEEPEPVQDFNELDPKRYGVIVSSGWKRGVLLPDLDGVDTPEVQVGIALQKAGITGEDYRLERFEVRRIVESER